MTWRLPDPGEKPSKSSKKNREGHRNGGADRAAAEGQAWEDGDRAHERFGRWRRRRD
ncbi:MULTISPECIES: hypothetical protein [unclassified Streptomyces]|uniref:hypothetical protein n=1 Tax=unclassified Streptomyces TaxID=2593676 RepID=UPI00039F3DF4|nr:MULTISPECIES: hypothetical protein [unclassified Streptomyces]MYX37818.1 hypothetical protein [Streptomyces sp. SID8377]